MHGDYIVFFLKIGLKIYLNFSIYYISSFPISFVHALFSLGLTSTPKFCLLEPWLIQI